jgi:alpha-D-xyloside xylohydrolase
MEICDDFVESGLLRVNLTQRAAPPAMQRFFTHCCHVEIHRDYFSVELREHSDETKNHGDGGLERVTGSLAPLVCVLTVRRLREGVAELSVQSLPLTAERTKSRSSLQDSESRAFSLGDWTVALQMQPFSVAVRDASGAAVFSTPACDINVGSVLQSAAVTVSRNGVGLSFDFDQDELFYGTGEDFGPFVKNGSSRSIINSDALGNHEEFVYQNAPHIFSSDGRAIENCSELPFSFDVGHSRRGVLTFREKSAAIAVRLHCCNTIPEAVRSVRQYQKPVRGVPEWAFGLWLSRCYYADEAEIRSVLQRARDYQIPVGTINLDARCWMRPTHRTDFIPDPQRYPDFFGLIRSIIESGTQVCLWENPYVSSSSTLYEEGCDRGFFARDKNGSPYPYQWVPVGLAGFPQTPHSGLVDFTNPAAVRWWQDLHLPFLKAGVKCFKTDFGEEIPADACFSDGRSGWQLRNSYSDLYNLAVSEVLEEVHRGEGIIWARSGYRHTQATPVKWAGDGQTDWRSLRATLRAGLAQAFGGALFWSHDVGGFYGPSPDPELFLRWSQLAMWGSHIRLHGTSPREPWEFGDSVLRLFRLALHVRMTLKPYFVASFNGAVSRQESFLVPLVYGNQSSLACKHVDDMFFAGPDIVVAPFLSPEKGREIWLPRGDWTDMRSGLRVPGDAQLASERTDFLPVFYRSGSPFADLFARATQTILANAASPAGDGR